LEKLLQPRPLRPLDNAQTGPLASAEVRLLPDIDASFDIFYNPTGDLLMARLTGLLPICKTRIFQTRHKISWGEAIST
jgi:hypothetical protein